MASVTLPLVSEDVVFAITRKANSQLRLGRTNIGEEFSVESSNLVNLNRRKHSAALGKTVSVSATTFKRKNNKVGRGVTAALGTAGQTKTKKVRLTLNSAHSAVTLRKELAGHRPDLVRAAILRVHRLSQAAHRAFNASKVAAPKKQ